MIRFIMVFIAGVVLLPAGAQAQELPPVDGRYNSRIITDDAFVDGFDVTTREIQQFLEKKGENCEGDLCLKNYQDPDTDTSAARVIREASNEFGIDPRVIVVTLQKENSLITEEEPEEWQYRTAMGYGCPEGEDCEADFFGFSNQVNLATNLLRAGYDRACGDFISHWKWQMNPQWTAGNVVEVDGRPTYIGNCATASLYNYTPHRVDSAWRHVDNQYFYGNYNFVTYMQRWFDEF